MWEGGILGFIFLVLLFGCVCWVLQKNTNPDKNQVRHQSRQEPGARARVFVCVHARVCVCARVCVLCARGLVRAYVRACVHVVCV